MFLRYFERGYVPIPVYAGGKNPAIKDWSRWCRERPPTSLVEEWQEKHKGNVGITCGPASGIVVVDIDTDDPTFMALFPPSTVVRKGKKGEARVFRWREGISSQSMPGLDILADGRQLLVPPSIHPETKLPYRWITPDTLENTDSADLPELDLGFLKKIPKGRVVGAPGRNNKLVDIISAMRGRGEPEARIVEEVYSWDAMHHSPRLFTDASEGYRATNDQEARTNAWSLVTSVTKSLIESGKFVMGTADALSVQVSDIQEKAIVEKYKTQEYPEPTGLIKDIRDLIVEYSERAMPNIALGGAIALMGGVCSNRFRFNRTWSNVYVLNLAPTGAGKSFPQTIINIILNEKLGSDLMGFGNYHSSSAFCKNLVSKRERLDIIDEVSSLFSQIKDGGTYQTAILEEMCKVWSASSGKYLAAEYADTEKDSASCFNPCVSILGSSTIEGLKSNINKSMTIKGLIPRFLIFSHENYGKLKADRLNESLLEDVSLAIGTILDRPKRILTTQADIMCGPIYDPEDISPNTEDGRDFFQAMRIEYANRTEQEQSLPLKDMLTRAKEQIMKLSLVHAVGNARRVTVADLEWARKTWEVSLHNATPLIHETAVDNDWEKDVARATNLMLKSGGTISAKRFHEKLYLQPQRVKSVLEHLSKSGQIRIGQNRNGNDAYFWISDDA